MKTLVSILLGTSAAIAAGFAVATPASAAPYGYSYGDDYASYREYCRDPGYRHRYAYYCDQFYDDDEDYDSYDYGYSAYPYYDDSYYPSTYSYYPYSYYPYSSYYGPSVGFNFRFGDRDRHHRYYRSHRNFRNYDGRWRH